MNPRSHNVCTCTLITFLLFLFGAVCLNGQILSQNSNYFLYYTSLDELFISSNNGLNVSNGRKNEIFRSEIYQKGDVNIQSNFYEDSQRIIWFATYNAIHSYDPFHKKFNIFQFEDLYGDLINQDYRIIHQSRDTLWIQSGELSVIFDTKEKTELEKFCSEVPDAHLFYIQKK